MNAYASVVTGYASGFLLTGMFPDKFVQQQDEKNSSEKKADRRENGRVIERFCMHGGASMITVFFKKYPIARPSREGDAHCDVHRYMPGLSFLVNACIFKLASQTQLSGFPCIRFMMDVPL